MQTKKNWYTPSIDKTEQFGDFEKLWIASGAKLKGKERLTPRPTSPGLPYMKWCKLRQLILYRMYTYTYESKQIKLLELKYN